MIHRGRCLGFLGLFLFSSLAFSEDPKLNQVNWFQITFCQRIQYLEFSQLPSASDPRLVAWGLAADQSATDGLYHYYNWNLLDGSELAHVPFATSEGITRPEITSTVRSKLQPNVYIFGYSHDIPVFDLTTQTVVKRFSGHRAETYAGTLSADESQLAATDQLGNIWIWKTGAPDMPYQKIVPSTRPIWLEFIENGTKIRTITTHYIQIFNVETGALENTIDIEVELAAASFQPASIIMSSDGSTFYATADPSIVAINTADGKRKWSHDFGTIDGPFGQMTNSPWGRTMTPSGKCLIVGEYHGYQVLNPTDGSLIFKQNDVADWYYEVTADGRYFVATGGCDVKVYEVPDVCR